MFDKTIPFRAPVDPQEVLVRAHEAIGSPHAALRRQRAFPQNPQLTPTTALACVLWFSPLGLSITGKPSDANSE